MSTLIHQSDAALRVLLSVFTTPSLMPVENEILKHWRAASPNSPHAVLYTTAHLLMTESVDPAFAFLEQYRNVYDNHPEFMLTLTIFSAFSAVGDIKMRSRAELIAWPREGLNTRKLAYLDSMIELTK